MDVRFLKKETDSKEVASMKAYSPMEVRPSGSTIETKDLQ